MFEIVGHEGVYISGIRGSITGSGFDIGIIDDPFKNREEAKSETIRARVWECGMRVLSTPGRKKMKLSGSN
ncbi:hypothetical protein MSSIT_2193 [Methanosarcina siciliae T4/M]|uniref:Uncharacterized protein n=2 Tax=Methanosarcina siciliae TaxID=38027 RepID=A0A0E3LB04_9EURY|nr:terminase family protein [Methanosarcina siciliae]AKB28912.1 hypothetical protein MSSIT_2193 [Methanosarcina siciliae T4/M]AKB32926.1 hypothetical protein MSSIH_2236 [Methanosarcina siciliae HI350]